MSDKKIHYADHLEAEIGALLTERGIRFIHESQGAALDFYLPDYDIYLEVKQFYSERVIKQLALHDNVILIQGRRSIAVVRALLG